MKKKQIHFEWGAEKQIKITHVGQEESFFYEAYRQALAGVAEIVRAGMVAVNGTERDPFTTAERADCGPGCRPEFPDNKYLYNYPNNMLVFSGDRGAGKSSAMLSFVYSLENPKSTLYSETFLRETIVQELPGVDCCAVSNMLRSTQFVSIPPIDPTTLENSDQILTVILARMFQLAIDAWEQEDPMPPRPPRQDRLNQKNELMKQFSTCYEHVRAIKNQDGRDSKYEGLEVLADLRDNSSLKHELADLVENLLRFKCAGSPKNPYLIIQIDDTDMNIQHAYSILEDIRKYLVIPRVIIVMAANLTHLRQVVESGLLGDYDPKLPKGQEYANHIAQQYITKLFPQTRQINLPELGTYFKEHADSIEMFYHVAGRQVLPEDGWPCSDAQEQIFRLIYRKTGLVFLKDKNRLHDIIPTNMRLHAHFLAMLIQMEDVEKPSEEAPQFFLNAPSSEEGLCSHRKALRTRLENILRFRDYFLGTWVTNNLNGKHAELIGQLDQIDVSRKVRFVHRQLWNMCLQTRPEEERKAYSLSEDQCGYADMVRLCRYLEATSIEESDSRFIFAVHTYFSLLGHSIVLEELIDFYDELKDPAVNGLRCPFSRLYSLYGSRIFPYTGSLNEAAQDAYCTEVNITDNAESRVPLVSRWTGDAGKAKDFRLKDTVSLLYSMLADYQPAQQGSKLLLDLCSSIPNCLYMHKKEFLEMSPLAKTMYGPANSLMTEDKDWIAMRNSALLTVLNWDVQDRVGQTLLKLTKPVEKNMRGTHVLYDEWPIRVEAFYNELSKPLHGLGGDAPAIAALDKIKFGGWLVPPEFKKENVLDKREWRRILNKLNPYIRDSEKAPAKRKKKDEGADPRAQAEAAGKDNPPAEEAVAAPPGPGPEKEKVDPAQEGSKTDEVLDPLGS